jgi:hypothetical protein
LKRRVKGVVYRELRLGIGPKRSGFVRVHGFELGDCKCSYI